LVLRGVGRLIPPSAVLHRPEELVGERLHHERDHRAPGRRVGRTAGEYRDGDEEDGDEPDGAHAAERTGGGPDEARTMSDVSRTTRRTGRVGSAMRSSSRRAAVATMSY